MWLKLKDLIETETESRATKNLSLTVAENVVEEDKLNMNRSSISKASLVPQTLVREVWNEPVLSNKSC